MMTISHSTMQKHSTPEIVPESVKTASWRALNRGIQSGIPHHRHFMVVENAKTAGM